MRGRHFLLLLALMACACPAVAQETTGQITGRVLDSQGLAVPGVTVTVSGPQGTKTIATDTYGRFSVPFLTPGVYGVRAELQGFKAFERSDVRVVLGQTADMPITLQPGGLTEVVNVTGDASVIDTTSTTAGAVLSSDLLENVPVGRRLADALYLAPGVSSSSTAGHMNPSVSGGSGLDNLYVIDGVNVTSTGYGGLGSYSAMFGSLGNATPFDFIQEVQVKTAGYDAEFGQSIGGVVNVVTKSGSNAFKGSGFAYVHPQTLESPWTQVQTPNGTVQTLGSHTYDGGAEVGGPIINNHLFFFGAIDPSREVQTFQAPAGFPLLSLGGVNRVRDTTAYSAKLTYQASNRHRFDASFFGDPSNGLDGAQRPGSLTATTTQQFSTLSYGGHNQTGRYEGVFSSHWLIEASYARALNRIAETPDSSAWQIVDRTVTPNIRSGGLGYFEPGNRSLNNQYSVKSTNLLGGHEIKYGYEYSHANWDQLISYTGPTFTAPNGQQSATGAQIQIIPDPTFGQVYRVVRGNFTTGAMTTQHYQDVFVQDTWRVGRLTVNPGLRYEQETLNGNAISSFSLGNNWAPRIGGTFDATGDGKTKIYANWGRFYSRVPNDLAARALSAEVGVSLADYFDSALTQPIPNGTLAGKVTNHYVTNGATAGDTIDPNAKMSYLTEFVAGFEREVMPNTSFGVRYIYRNIGRVLEDVANCPSVAYFLDETASTACGNVSYILTNPSSATPINPAAIAAVPAFANVSFADPVHRYDAVEVTLNRRLTNHWSGLASYRWSRLRGNYEGFYRDDNGQSDPGISSLYDFPQNDPTYTSIGVAQQGFLGDIRYLGDPNGILPLDRPHNIKLYGNYVVGNLNLGLGINGSSGAPLTPLAPNPVYGNPGEIPSAARGSGIQTVDGFMTRTPFTASVDLQASYSLVFGARRMTLMADVFNLFDSQSVLNYDSWTSLTFGGPANPNFGQPTSGIIAGPQIQVPRQVRLGVRFTF